MGCRFLLQGLFPTQGLNPCLPALACGFFTTEPWVYSKKQVFYGPAPSIPFFFFQKMMIISDILYICLDTCYKIHRLEHLCVCLWMPLVNMCVFLCIHILVEHYRHYLTSFHFTLDFGDSATSVHLDLPIIFHNCIIFFCMLASSFFYQCQTNVCSGCFNLLLSQITLPWKTFYLCHFLQVLVVIAVGYSWKLNCLLKVHEHFEKYLTFWMLLLLFHC